MLEDQRGIEEIDAFGHLAGFEQSLHTAPPISIAQQPLTYALALTRTLAIGLILFK